MGENKARKPQPVACTFSGPSKNNGSLKLAFRHRGDYDKPVNVLLLNSTKQPETCHNNKLSASSGQLMSSGVLIVGSSSIGVRVSHEQKLAGRASE